MHYKSLQKRKCWFTPLHNSSLSYAVYQAAIKIKSRNFCNYNLNKSVMLHFHTLTIGKIDGFFLRKPLLFKNQLVLFN